VLKEQILNFTTVVGCTVTVGIFFDQVLIKREQRLQISKLLSSPRSRVPFHDAFYRYINLINDSVFRRFFSAPFLSFKYFVATSALSTAFLLIVLLVQFLSSPASFPPLLDTPTKKLALTVCFLSNLIIDWVSIGQTQTFFIISAKLGSIRESALLIASDFILTINFFILIFSVTLAVFISWADKPTIIMPFNAVVLSSELSPLDSNYRLITGGRISKMKQTDYFLTGTDGDRPVSGRITVYSDSDSVNLHDAINLATRTTGVRSWGYRGSLEQPTFLGKQFPKQAILRANAGKIARGSSEWKALTEHYWKETPSLTIMAGDHPDGWNKEISYTVGFKAAEVMQQEFPSVIQAPLHIVHINDLLDSYAVGRSGFSWPVVYACSYDKNRSDDWSISKSVSIFDSHCGKHVVLLSNQHNELAAKMRDRPDGWAGVSIPLNTLFMTSMLMTFLIYAFALFLIVAKFLSTTFLAHLRLIEPFFAKAPLGSAGIVIGIFLYLLTLI